MRLKYLKIYVVYLALYNLPNTKEELKEHYDVYYIL